MGDTFIFTPDNLIENIHKIGPWSQCYLAEIAMAHFYPDKVNEDGGIEPSQMAAISSDWRGEIIKYQKEIGYKFFTDGYVNEH